MVWANIPIFKQDRFKTQQNNIYEHHTNTLGR